MIMLLRLSQSLCRRVGEVERTVDVDLYDWRRRRRLLLCRHLFAVSVDLQDDVGKPEKTIKSNQTDPGLERPIVLVRELAFRAAVAVRSDRRGHGLVGRGLLGL